MCVRCAARAVCKTNMSCDVFQSTGCSLFFFTIPYFIHMCSELRCTSHNRSAQSVKMRRNMNTIFTLFQKKKQKKNWPMWKLWMNGHTFEMPHALCSKQFYDTNNNTKRSIHRNGWMPKPINHIRRSCFCFCRQRAHTLCEYFLYSLHVHTILHHRLRVFEIH